MRWETLKRRIVEYVLDNPDAAGSELINANAKASGKTISAYVNDLDIRNVGALREHVPRAFPTYLRGQRMLIAEVNGEEWTVRLKGSD